MGNLIRAYCNGVRRSAYLHYCAFEGGSGFKMMFVELNQLPSAELLSNKLAPVPPAARGILPVAEFTFIS